MKDVTKTVEWNVSKKEMAPVFAMLFLNQKQEELLIGIGAKLYLLGQQDGMEESKKVAKEAITSAFAAVIGVSNGSPPDDVL